MVAVSYYCPRCGAVAELDRDARLADKSVTPFPLAGWAYASASDDFEGDEWDGVQFACGVDAADWSHPPDASDTDDSPGCGEAFYLNFVRFEDGERVEGEPESEFVQLSEGDAPTGPGGPNGTGFSR
jgi:hypothetical protein